MTPPNPTTPARKEGGELLALVERVEAARRADNSLDVLVEIALFRPGSVYKAIRANAAGTKVIYTDAVGNDVTCRAEDWTLSHDDRVDVAHALRARALSPARLQEEDKS